MVRALIKGYGVSLGMACFLISTVAEGGGATFVVPGSKAASETSCVEPTPFMRRYHMEVIKHQRDETVHHGIRSTRHSLAGCVDCHGVVTASGEGLPIDQKGQFCGSCHAYTAVQMNCFGCHAAKPTAPHRATGTSADDRERVAAGGRALGTSVEQERRQ